MQRFLLRALTGLLILAVAGTIYKWPSIRRLHAAVTLFDKEHIVENFRSMDRLFHSRKIEPAQTPFEFRRRSVTLPESYAYNGERRNLEDFLEKTATVGLLVLRDDTILHEDYRRGYDATTRHISWSMGKSVVSALVGIAVAEGRIDSIEDPITKYVPELKGSGLDGVSIKNVLQMSTGLQFNEDYGDFYSDINRLGRVIAFGSSLDEFTPTFQRNREPGTYHHYVSVNTQALGMLLVRVTNKNLSEYLGEKIWQRMGTEAACYWLTDDYGMEFAIGGLNAVLRDYGRFGRLYLNGGSWEGEQLVPKDWVRASITPDAPHLMPGENPASAHTAGYGYHWWIPPEPDGEFLAIGIYNQYIYVYPKKDLVIVKLSANASYTKNSRTLESVAVFRAIAAAMN